MELKIESLVAKSCAEWFEGVIFQNRMTDKKLGAFCKTRELCLTVGACLFHERLSDIVALGRWNGTCYSAINSVPLPFIVNPYQNICGKSAVMARNILSRLMLYIEESENSLFREYIEERERCGISYQLG